MKRFARFRIAAFLTVLLVAGCVWAAEYIEPYTMVSGNIEEGTYRPEDIITFNFSDNVVFEGGDGMAIARSLIEAGKTPGLGVKSLHGRGIIGKDVRVAIIDQPSAMTHAEYKGKLVEYYSDVAWSPDDSMHGAGVASLLVGDECGTAPGAMLYFAGIVGEQGDAAPSYAEGLRWIIGQNATLPEGDKIRVVSVSANLMYQQKNPEAWDVAVAEAKAAGILVLDCRRDDSEGGAKETFLTEMGYYDLDAPDDLSRFTPGTPRTTEGDWLPSFNHNPLYTPACRRTSAMEMTNGSHWRYTGAESTSWSVPYAAGVLAMGWQVNPALTNDEIVALLRKTAYVHKKSGALIINPVAFIEAIENPQPEPEPNPGTNPDSSSGGGGCDGGGYALVVLAIAALFSRKRII